MGVWRLPEDSALYRVSLDWRTPLLVSALYAIVVTVLSRRNAARPPAPQADRRAWSLFRAATLAHNVLLLLFSVKTFAEAAPLVLSSLLRNTAFDWFCDVGGRQAAAGLAFWTWVFYLSKYYELLDTAILLAKGRPSSFLQTFHHAGAIVSMWLLAASRAHGAWIFVVFNSGIHSLMYAYYALTVLGYAPRWKRAMTRMQIGQFFVGLPLALVYIFVPGCIRSDPATDRLAALLGVRGYAAHVLALVFNFAYVAALIVLFLDFSRRTYSSRKDE